MAKRVGVILSGCGVYDGSEIHEAVSILTALDRRGAQAVCMAPNIRQAQVVNHLTKQPMEEERNCLVESARVARGNIVALAEVKAGDLDALIFPGGFGAAKNLSTFAFDGAECRVNEQVARLLEDVHTAGKPVGLVCISPVIAAQVFGRMGIRLGLTVGTDRDTAEAIERMGAVHYTVGPMDVHVDEEHKIVSTPCYMNDVGPWVVYQGAQALVEQVLRLTGDTASLIRKQLDDIHR